MAIPLCSLGLLIFFCSLFLKSESFDFVYNGFNGSNLVLDGYARIKYKALKLTDRSQNVIGHAFCPDRIPMFKNSSSNVSSFSTHFVFQIVPSDANRGGYGFAFILSPSKQLSGAEAGQYLGVISSSKDGNSSNHIFMVEFDTVSGYNEKSDSYGNHIGINVNGMNSSASESASYYEGWTLKKEDIDLEDEAPIQAWIDYDGLAVNVTVAPFSIPKPIKPLLSLSIDLSPVMKDYMYAGFSAATGEKTSSHYILGWSFKLNGTADPLDVSQFSASSSSQNKLQIALISTFSVALFLLVIV